MDDTSFDTIARTWLGTVDIPTDYDTLRDNAHRGTTARLLLRSLETLVTTQQRLGREITAQHRALDELAERAGRFDMATTGAAQDAARLATITAEYNTARDSFGQIARAYREQSDS